MSDTAVRCDECGKHKPVHFIGGAYLCSSCLELIKAKVQSNNDYVKAVDDDESDVWFHGVR